MMLQALGHKFLFYYDKWPVKLHMLFVSWIYRIIIIVSFYEHYFPRRSHLFNDHSRFHLTVHFDSSLPLSVSAAAVAGRTLGRPPAVPRSSFSRSSTGICDGEEGGEGRSKPNLGTADQ